MIWVTGLGEKRVWDTSWGPKAGEEADHLVAAFASVLRSSTYQPPSVLRRSPTSMSPGRSRPLACRTSKTASTCRIQVIGR